MYELSLDLADPYGCPALLAVSRRIHAESRPHLLDLNTLKIRTEEHYNHFSIAVGSGEEVQVPYDGKFVDDVHCYPGDVAAVVRRIQVEVCLPPAGLCIGTLDQDKLFQQLCILALLTRGNSRLRLEVHADRVVDAFAALRLFRTGVSIVEMGFVSRLVTAARLANLRSYWGDLQSLLVADSVGADTHD